MKHFSRTQRLSEQIKRVLASTIQLELQDPRLSFVSVTAVKLAKDVSFAKVYISSIADDEKIEEQLKVLEKAKGFLRKKLGKEISTRIVPELHFVYDISTREANRMTKLVQEVMEKDAKRFPKLDDSESS